MTTHGAKSKKKLKKANKCIMEHGKSATKKNKHMMDCRQQCKLDEIMLQGVLGVKPVGDNVELDNGVMYQFKPGESNSDDGWENRFAPFLEFNAFEQKDDKASQFAKKVTEMIATCSQKKAMNKLLLIKHKLDYYTKLSGMNQVELKAMVDKLMFWFCKASVIAASSGQPSPIVDNSSCSTCRIPYHYKIFQVHCQCGFIFQAHVGLCTMELLKQTCPICNHALRNATPLTQDECLCCGPCEGVLEAGNVVFNQGQ